MKYQTHACQAKAREGCILHALRNSDLCPTCAKAEAAGESVPRITRPVWDRQGQRVKYANPVGDIVAKAKRMLNIDDDIKF